jgi:hypothetical protein
VLAVLPELRVRSSTVHRLKHDRQRNGITRRRECDEQASAVDVSEDGQRGKMNPVSPPYSRGRYTPPVESSSRCSAMKLSSGSR